MGDVTSPIPPAYSSPVIMTIGTTIGPRSDLGDRCLVLGASDLRTLVLVAGNLRSPIVGADNLRHLILGASHQAPDEVAPCDNE